LRVYTAADLDAELEGAAAAFVRGGVSFAGGVVRLSAVFAFYAEDFGGRDGIAALIAPYLEDEHERRCLRDAFAAGREEYETFDWSLNGAED
jgi:hypothetical protein